MNDSTNYYLKSLQILAELENSPKKPSILLHACCGICAIYPIRFLSSFFDVTVYYSNSNIENEEEYEKRYDVLTRYITSFNFENDKKVKVIKDKYDHDEFLKDLLPYKECKEGGERCHVCYEKRMRKAYQFAEENGFDFFTTTLTVSRQKNSRLINEIGKQLEENFSRTKYFYSDFKKNAGGEIANAYAKEKGYYMQIFCGCEFSKKG